MKIFGYMMALFLIGYALAYFAALPKLRRLIGPRYVASFAIVAFASVFSPNAYVFWAACAFAVLATVRTRLEAVCRYVMLLALVPGVSIGLQIAGTFFGIYTAHVALLLATLAVIPFLPAGRVRPIPRMRAEDFAILTLYAIFFIAGPRFVSVTELARSMVTGASEFLIPYYLFRRNVRTAEEAYQVIGCLAVVGVSVGVLAIFEARKSWPLFDLAVLRLSDFHSVAGIFSMRGTSLRASVAFGNPLLMAFFMMLATIAILSARSQFRRLPWLLCIAVIGLGMLVPQSRGALIAIVPGVIVMFATQKRYGAAAGMLAASGIGATALLNLRDSSARVAAFMGQGQQFNGYYDYRSALFDRGVQEAVKHPFFGQQINVVLNSLQDMKQGEGIVDPVNVYLTMVLISGLVGLATFAIFTTGTMRKLIARARRTGGLDATRGARTFLLAALTATLVFITGMSFMGRLETLVALLFALSRTVSASLIHRRALVPAAAVRRLGDPPPAAEPDRVREPALTPA